MSISGMLFAANNAQIEQFIKDNFVRGQVPVKITDSKMLNNGFEQITVDIGGRKMAMFTKGDLLFTDIIDMKANKSLAQEANTKIADEAIASVYKNEDKNNIITIGNNPNNPTELIITDPECPYCRAELKKMRADKDKVNYKVVLASVHGKTGFEKIHLIYKEMKNAKTDSEKFAILDKYYAPDVKIDSKVSDEDIENAAKIGEKYFNAGLRGVPFVKNIKDLK